MAVSMASRQLGPRGNKDSEPSSSTGPDINDAPPPPPPPPPSTAVLDIGALVVRYNRLLELLYPFGLVWSAGLYVIRWENYLLTLTLLLILCVLFYFPALLIGSLVALAVVGMAIGKYYSQTKLSSNLKLREFHHVEYLDEDTQLLKRCKKDQKASHRLLLEYRQINSNIESVVVMASNALEYLYKIILWKSLEVSLCVTVLLGVLFMLLCTVYLRFLLASLPLLIICFNKYFFKRTVELWKTMIRCVYSNFRMKQKNRAPHSTQTTTMVDSTLIQDHLIESELEPGTVGSSDSDNMSFHAQNQGSASARFGINGTVLSSSLSSAAATGDWATGGGSKEVSKGFCNKCNTSLAKLLKRKHDCNYCGQSFCGSCTVKVKRAVLGATSPAAFEESVRVCLDCKGKLDDLATSR